MAKRTRQNYRIRNPRKWIGRTVNHWDTKSQLMWDFPDDVTVCEWTHKVISMDEAEECRTFFSPSQWDLIRKHPHFDPCYWYSEDALGEFCDEMSR